MTASSPIPSSFPQLCTPSLVYLGLSLLSTIFSVMNMSLVANVINILFIGIWTWFLNYLCTIGYSTASWLLLLFPFLIMILVIFTVGIDALLIKKDDKADTSEPQPSPSPIPRK